MIRHCKKIGKTALLPCPFCGAQPSYKNDARMKIISCENNDCPVQPAASGLAASILATRWNTRGSTVRQRMIDSVNRVVDENQMLSAEHIVDGLLNDVPELARMV